MTDNIIIFFGTYLAYILVGVLVAIALWPPRTPRKLQMAAVAFGAALIAKFAVKSFILLFVQRARPYVAIPRIKNIIGSPIGEELQSFPSGHAMFFFALATVVFLYNRKLGWWFLAGAVLISIARVLGGVHWPTDVIYGGLIGALVGYLTEKAHVRFCH